MSITTRFAPSPTGHLHLGHVHAAMFAWRRAREAGGRYLVRLEDIDAARCRPAYAAAILEDLAWLGLASDAPVRVQSAHLAEYGAVLDALRDRGLVYPCFCSRADIARAAAAPHGPEGTMYPGTCRWLAAGERASRLAAAQPHAWRLDTDRALAETGPLSYLEDGPGDPSSIAAKPAPFGDVILARRDAAASYHLAVAHDDAAQAVTLVTRGADLQAATSIHRLLQALMGWPPPRYAHHRLIMGPDGQRLAKRNGATPIRTLREAGHTADAVRALADAAALSNPGAWN